MEINGDWWRMIEKDGEGWSMMEYDGVWWRYDGVLFFWFLIVVLLVKWDVWFGMRCFVEVLILVFYFKLVIMYWFINEVGIMMDEIFEWDKWKLNEFVVFFCCVRKVCIDRWVRVFVWIVVGVYVWVSCGVVLLIFDGDKK